MPLTDEQTEAIKTLAGADPKDAADALKDGAHPVFQAVFRKGYGTAQGEYEGEDGKLTKAQAEAEAAKTRADKAEADLKEARAKQPDLEAALEKNNQEWQEKIAAKEEALTAEQEARKKERRARMKSDLRAEMGVINDSEFAEYLADKHLDRLKTGDDGNIVLLESPDSTVPVQIPQGQTPYKALAADILKDVAPDKKRSDVDSGGGANGGGGGGSGYDPAKAGKEMAEKQKAGADNSLAFK